MTGSVHRRIRPNPFAFVVVLLALLGCARGPCITIVAPDGTTRATVAIEVASTGPQREVGLMFRKHLDDHAGMIFVFPDEAPRNFWMHNTPIPLDMIFADAAGRVTGIVANAEPYSDKLLGVEGNAEYVLEVNGGFCAKNGIKPGDKMDFSGFTPHTSE
jgi:uncharacterized membrane protein (UPF0127 family)